MTYPETENFQIKHAEWNEGTRFPLYFIGAKENTLESRALVPPLACSYHGWQELVEPLHAAQAWYSENRKCVERKAA